MKIDNSKLIGKAIYAIQLLCQDVDRWHEKEHLIAAVRSHLRAEFDKDVLQVAIDQCFRVGGAA
jgi:hypothetical protein